MNQQLLYLDRLKSRIKPYLMQMKKNSKPWNLLMVSFSAGDHSAVKFTGHALHISHSICV